MVFRTHLPRKRKQVRRIPQIENLESRLMLDATAVANTEHSAVFGVT